ncbi:signal peptide peptidase SppA, partial [Lysobacter sp. 2RAB21]
LDAASEDTKTADLFWLTDLWTRYLDDVAKARKLKPADLIASIDELPQRLDAVKGDMGKYALGLKLIDGLKTREEVDEMLTKRGVADEDAEGGFRQIAMD